MGKVSQVISLALKDSGVLGVGQSAGAEDLNDALQRANWMLDQWNRKRWLVYHLVDMQFTSTGSEKYSIGPRANFDTPVRPAQIEAAFFRQAINGGLPIDYPLELLMSREDYNNIALKSMVSFPSYLFYDPAWQETKSHWGWLYPWPIPQADLYALHISVRVLLHHLRSLDQDINLPPEYEAAICLNLAKRLRVAYQLGADTELNGLAKDALEVLRTSNAAIARLTMPSDLVRPGIYNPYSDQIR